MQSFGGMSSVQICFCRNETRSWAQLGEPRFPHRPPRSARYFATFARSVTIPHDPDRLFEQQLAVEAARFNT
jgi:hypothetical protein